MEHAGHSGVPDLFLFARNTKTKKPSIARFVEVKKPKERVSQDQKDEIALLKSFGLHARVLHLIERHYDLTDILYHRHRETIASPPPDPEVVGQG